MIDGAEAGVEIEIPAYKNRVAKQAPKNLLTLNSTPKLLATIYFVFYNFNSF